MLLVDSAQVAVTTFGVPTHGLHLSYFGSIRLVQSDLGLIRRQVSPFSHAIFTHYVSMWATLGYPLPSCHSSRDLRCKLRFKRRKVHSAGDSQLSTARLDYLAQSSTVRKHKHLYRVYTNLGCLSPNFFLSSSESHPPGSLPSPFSFNNLSTSLFLLSFRFDRSHITTAEKNAMARAKARFVAEAVGYRGESVKIHVDTIPYIKFKVISMR